MKYSQPKRPKTVKGYIKMLLRICNDSSYDLKNVTKDEVAFFGAIRAGIQNDLAEDLDGVMEKHNLKWGD